MRSAPTDCPHVWASTYGRLTTMTTGTTSSGQNRRSTSTSESVDTTARTTWPETFQNGESPAYGTVTATSAAAERGTIRPHDDDETARHDGVDLPGVASHRLHRSLSGDEHVGASREYREGSRGSEDPEALPEDVATRVLTTPLGVDEEEEPAPDQDRRMEDEREVLHGDGERVHAFSHLRS